MPTILKTKNSVTTTVAPTTLQQGELAVNITDKKMWVGNAATTPVQLFGAGADTTFTNISVSGVATFGAGTVSAPAITTTGDTNTGIYFPAADTIAFTEGGTESMRITSAGRLGIGTTTPQNLLVVSNGGAAGFEVVPATDISQFNYNRSTSAWVNVNYYANQQVFGYNGTSEGMRITSTGLVGIGTSSPNGAVTISTQLNALTGTGNTFGLHLYPAPSGTCYVDALTNSSSNSSLALRTYNNGTYTEFISNFAGNTTTFQTAGAERMRIDSSGNIGINNSSPANRLDVIGSTGADACQIKTTNSSTAINLILWNAVSSGDNVFTRFATDTTLTARGGITYNRAGGLVVYGTTSDYRAKDIIGSVLNSGEVIDSVPVYMGKMKGATQTRPMFIAHETPDYAHTGEKDAVDKDGNPAYQQMDVSSLVPVLWAEVQSLRKRLALLESK